MALIKVIKNNTCILTTICDKEEASKVAVRLSILYENLDCEIDKIIIEY